MLLYLARPCVKHWGPEFDGYEMHEATPAKAGWRGPGGDFGWDDSTMVGEWSLETVEGVLGISLEPGTVRKVWVTVELG